MVVRHRVAMSARTYAVVWAAEELGQQHPALLAPLHTEDAPLPELIQRAAGELERAGLFDQRGGLHPDLASTFQVLARPNVEFYGWIATQQPARDFSVLAAAGGDGAVLAVLDGDTLTLTPLQPTALAGALVDQLPPTPPAHGQSITAPAADLSTGDTGGRNTAFTGLEQPRPNSASGAFQRLDEAPRTAAAQLYAAARDRSGRRNRIPYPLNVLDLREGRWFSQHANQSGQVWVTAAPASRQSLAARLGELHRSLT
jgi:hypothetical protein